MTSPESTKSLDFWIKEKENKSDARAVWVLVGCKCDCESTVDKAMIEDIVNKYNVFHITCSSKTGESLKRFLL